MKSFSDFLPNSTIMYENYYFVKMFSLKYSLYDILTIKIDNLLVSRSYSKIFDIFINSKMLVT